MAKEATEKKAPAKKAVKKAPKKSAESGESTAVVRGGRKTREGVVVSAKMEKTVVVNIVRRVSHPLYGKVVLRSKKFKAHDLLGCDEGDKVEIMETRPISKDKCWRVTQILEKVK